MNINPMSVNLESSIIRHTPNDAARDLQQKGKQEKKVSESQPTEITKKDKVETSNETKEVDDLYTKITDKVKEDRSQVRDSSNNNDLEDIIRESNLKYEKTDEGERVTRVVNGEGELVRQIPSEAALRVYRDITNYLDRESINTTDEGKKNGSV